MLKAFIEISIIKTIRFNLHYFGKKGLLFPVIIAKNVMLKNMQGEVQLEAYKTGNVRIGFDGTGICDIKRQRSIWHVSGNVFLGENVKIAAGVKLSVGVNGILKIGKESSININTQIICMNNIGIGESVVISWDDLIMDSDFHQIQDQATLKEISKPIFIGNNVWIGCRAIILKGTSVSNGCVVAAGNVITGKHVEENCLITSTGIKKQNISWIR